MYYEAQRCCYIGAIVLIMAMNLRGVRIRLAFAIPTYAFSRNQHHMRGCSGFSCWAIGSGRSPRLAKYAEHGQIVGFALVMARSFRRGVQR